MQEGCDHLEGSPIGKCAVCGRTVCSECYTTVFNEMVCNGHEGLEEETAWELVGMYTDPSVLADRRFRLEECGIMSIAVESDEDAMELYVPAEEKEDGYTALHASGEEASHCGDCGIQYSMDMEACPLCGTKSAEPDDGPAQRNEAL